MEEIKINTIAEKLKPFLSEDGHIKHAGAHVIKCRPTEMNPLVYRHNRGGDTSRYARGATATGTRRRRKAAA